MGRIALLVVAFMTMVTCASCADNFSSPTPVPDTVRVGIGIYYTGGPPPGIGRSPVPGTITLKREGTLVTTRDLKDGQTLDLYVQPGSFVATAISGDAQCFPKAFTVADGSPVSVKVSCSIR